MYEPATTRRILRLLEKQHPGAFTELTFSTPYELMVATILSAQCTDERVNRVTPALFAAYGTPAALATAATKDLERLIRSTGFFRRKACSLIGMAQTIVERHSGELPTDIDALTKLPGVGRKTANVVLGHAFGIPGLPVDRHVLRVANRLGIVASTNPAVVEEQLGRALPDKRWTLASDTLILHGRRVCRPKPRCDDCQVRQLCRAAADHVSGPGSATPGRRTTSRGSPNTRPTRRQT